MSFGGFTRSSFEPHPEGVTIGQLVDWKNEPDGQYGPQVRVNFDTQELMEDGRPFRVAFWFGFTFNPKSNSYKFLKAMGEDVDNLTDDELQEINLDDYIGKRCQLVITHKKKPDGSIQSKVENLLPIKSRRATPPPVAKEPEKELVGAAARGGKWEGGDED